MRVVIDTNRLQSPELSGFLSMSPRNVAVVTDYVMMEAFKPGRLDGLQAAFSVLGRFPGQVLALKGTGSVCRLDPDGVAMAAAMVSQDETIAFPSFCEFVRRAERGGEIDDKLAERTQWAREQMAIMDVNRRPILTPDRHAILTPCAGVCSRPAAKRGAIWRSAARSRRAHPRRGRLKLCS